MTNDPILGFQEEFRFLSNFWYSKFAIDGHSYDFNEKWYMVNKTFDPTEVAQIRAASKPGDCKKIGRTVTLRPDWEEVKDAVMLIGLRAKFGQSDDMRARLLATGKRYLEETNTWNDTYWGVCNGKGKNMLGILLMQVRAELT